MTPLVPVEPGEEFGVGSVERPAQLGSNRAELRGSIIRFFQKPPQARERRAWQQSSRPLIWPFPATCGRPLFEEPIGQGVLQEYHLRVIVFDIDREEIARWIPEH